MTIRQTHPIPAPLPSSYRIVSPPPRRYVTARHVAMSPGERGGQKVSAAAYRTSHESRPTETTPATTAAVAACRIGPDRKRSTTTTNFDTATTSTATTIIANR